MISLMAKKNVLPFLILGGVALYVVSQSGGGGVSRPKNVKVIKTFDDLMALKGSTTVMLSSFGENAYVKKIRQGFYQFASQNPDLSLAEVRLEKITESMTDDPVANASMQAMSGVEVATVVYGSPSSASAATFYNPKTVSEDLVQQLQSSFAATSGGVPMDLVEVGDGVTIDEIAAAIAEIPSSQVSGRSALPASVADVQRSLIEAAASL